jgi:hypothetical protein
MQMPLFSRFRWIGCWIGFFVLMFIPGVSQETLQAEFITSSIYGTVTLSDGTPFPGVFILLQSTEFSQQNNTISDDSGQFRFLDLPPGPYLITFEMQGFKTLQFPVDVSQGRDRRIIIVMEDLSDPDIVIDGPPWLDTSSVSRWDGYR